MIKDSLPNVTGGTLVFAKMHRLPEVTLLVQCKTEHQNASQGHGFPQGILVPFLQPCPWDIAQPRGLENVILDHQCLHWKSEL